MEYEDVSRKQYKVMTNNKIWKTIKQFLKKYGVNK